MFSGRSCDTAGRGRGVGRIQICEPYAGDVITQKNADHKGGEGCEKGEIVDPGAPTEEHAYPRQHGTSAQCQCNVGPTSATLAQHCTDIERRSRAFRGD